VVQKFAGHCSGFNTSFAHRYAFILFLRTGLKVIEEMSQQRQSSDSVAAGSRSDDAFVKQLMAARRKEELGATEREVLAAYEAASAADAHRAEALHGAARFCRNKGLNQQGYEYASKGLLILRPEGVPAAEGWIYDYGLLDEYAVNAYWSGHYQECLDACTRLLREVRLRADTRARVESNANFARQKLALLGLMTRRSQDDLKPVSDVNLVDRAKTEAMSSAANIRVFERQIKIFRTIHVVWVGDESRRPDNCIKSWIDNNPDWNVKIWGNDELSSVRWDNETHMRSMLTQELCGVADMMRWEILYHHGGLAVDADSVCVRPLADWLFEPEIFAIWENEIARPGLIANGYVYSHPGNRLVREVISEIKRLPNMTDGLAWQLTGPVRLTETVKKLRYTDITIYPSHFFAPRHLTGVTYSGSGPIFAKQFWGRAIPSVYDELSKTKPTD
jgi:mannosyltransferase OCH1-like enzyme